MFLLEDEGLQLHDVPEERFHGTLRALDVKDVNAVEAVGG